jgi:hypothetical protein
MRGPGAVFGCCALGGQETRTLITWDSTFGSNPVTCTSRGTGTAVDDGAGNITVTDVSWYFIGGGNEYSATINGATILAPTYTPVTSPPGALPAGSELIGNTGTCTTITFAGTDPCLSTGYRSSWGVPVFRTGLRSDPGAAPPAARHPTSPTSVPLTAAGWTSRWRATR